MNFLFFEIILNKNFPSSNENFVFLILFGKGLVNKISLDLDLKPYLKVTISFFLISIGVEFLVSSFTPGISTKITLFEFIFLFS